MIVAASIVNPIHEELFVTAYLVTALKELRSPWFAINTSVVIRLTYHLYQGGQGVVGVIAIGLVFAWWYARNGRLWPLVVAHAVFDFVGLMAYPARNWDEAGREWMPAQAGLCGTDNTT